MKKIISFFLALTFILSTSVFAAETDEMSKALQTVKERLGISDGFDDFKSSSYEDEFGSTYIFMWNNSETTESLEISCNNSGIITSYYHYIPEYSGGNKPAFSDNLKGKAMATAQEFIKKINPLIYPKVVFEDKESIADTQPYNFSFNFNVSENGYKVSTNSGYISLNSTGDRITNFHLNYIKDISFKSPDSILSKEEAATSYADKLGLTLVYKMYKSNDDIIVYPAYIEKETGEKYIDAFTGEVFTPPLGEVSPLYNAKQMNAAGSSAMAEEAVMDRASFSEIEIKELNEVSGLISKEKAEKIVRSNKIINLANGLNLESLNLSRDYYEKDKYIYNLVFRNPESPSEINGRKLTTLRATLDAKTGDIMSFSKYYSYNEKNTKLQKISSQKAKEIADNTLASLGTENKADFKFLDDADKNTYYFTYTRIVNGIPFISNTANVSVDEYSGEVLSWSISNYDIEFPSLENVISTEDAVSKLFEQVKYEPIYVVYYDNAKKEHLSNLVYSITDNYNININAVTGKLANYKGEDIDKANKAVTYTDLDGHYAKDKIEKLAKYGIALSGISEFKPDSAITQKELLAYILMAFEGEKNLPCETEEDVKYIYRRAIRLGYIKESEKAPDSSVLRGLAAKIIIRALGYSEVAELNEIYISPFRDSGDYSGYLALIYGLGIAKGDGNGNFYPLNNITKAETLTMLYNYLSR